LKKLTDLLGSGDVNKTKVSLEVGNVGLKILESSGNLELKLVGLPALGLHNLGGHLPNFKKKIK
jgi:hypothetical protein